MAVRSKVQSSFLHRFLLQMPMDLVPRPQKDATNLAAHVAPPIS